MKRISIGVTAFFLLLLVTVALGAQEDGKKKALDSISEAQGSVASLQQSHLAYEKSAQAALRSASTALNQISGLAKKMETAGGSSELAAMTREVRSLSTGADMQLTAMQQAMENESRKFTALSNVMKTKHETAMNSISNIR